MAKGRERQGKFYFRNEKEVMEDLGLTVTKGSGSGWVDKEDGYNDHILAQLKSTDKASYSLKLLDLEKLEYNASVSNKIPVFIVQFLKNDSRYALMAIDDIPLVAEYLKTGEVKKPDSELLKDIGEILDEDLEQKPKPKKKKIVSSKNARDAFYKDKQKQYEGKKYR